LENEERGLIVDTFEKAHIFGGRSLIRIPGVITDLADDPESWGEIWSELREELLPEWIAEHPGTRPLAWWVFEHQNERPVLHPMRPDAEATVRKEQTYLGILHTQIAHGYGAPDGELWPFQEGETDYLDRMGLLEMAEREALEAEENDDD
jgi:hypothetical protein